MTASAPTKQMQSVKVKGKRIKYKQERRDSVLDTGKAIKLYAEGKSQADIARLFDVNESVVSRRLAPYKDQLDELRTYQADKATWQDMAANRMLKAILDKDIEGEKLSSLGSTYKILNEANRLQTGQSTSNIALKVVDLSKYCLDDANSGS